ncbi:ShlB/FhaC/HecB family hemolysin secretion/activation protein [Nostoc sp. FACHB-87]|uniref:ShlB/FhaC/HecB family hemolysin secretion/activation protein n=1 Tax=Nostocales TaxID=1161 RepID=UPI00168842BE|nr:MULTISPECIES: ShlB/FhaC/HecB family hemolysin secretion/activation protein [Nostocales]MBD2303475.1 ShlB/FhaC/HecB family hemolysin secretion/activation protein [Nostoc sp. FACHB-190]MBD2457326.1 ShlB/FhaC/HecB family hemolysin secretion/activation protein [Nostoc sp. FACHB-87]MBD2478395.1 ShlB/FhaC/HecB family hemolysin secretion/activation protein [Anabaena sp. FACHB-83]MBD2491217.1 ShlB/FhaC/HecB family hemolysin secretion/activation protein [Aulosira sp. FACHB-615]
MISKFFGAFIVLALFDCSVKAQINSIPRDVQPPSTTPLPNQEPQPIPTLPNLPAPTPSTTPEEEFDTNQETFTVSKFEVIGGTVFSKKVLDQILEKYTNRPVTLADLYQARKKISDLYLSKGYIQSGAYIPPQKIQDGVVKIQIIETKLKDRDIEVIGTKRLNPGYIRSRIAASNLGPLNKEVLVKSLQLLRIDPLIKNLSADLRAGNLPGELLLVVEITEAKTFSTQLSFDNQRSPSVGDLQRQLQLKEANLLGLGDGLNIAYSNTEGSNFLNVAYSIPLNPHEGTLSFNYGIFEGRVIENPFSSLDIKSGSQFYELTFRQPIIRSVNEEFALGLTASRRETEISFVPLQQRIPFPQPGSDNEGRTRISALRFFQEWTVRNSRQAFALRSQFNLGIGAFNATVNPTAPDSRFFSWELQSQWAQLLAPDTLVLLRFSSQLSTTNLVSLEQFGLGGLSSVRGYRQDLLLGNNGTFASAEIQFPIFRLPQINAKLQGIYFTDIGIVWNSTSNNSTNTLASTGLGLRWSQGDRFFAQLDWGLPLMSVDSPRQTLQENGIYFQIQYNPF